jgi:hypothetical protein
MHGTRIIRMEKVPIILFSLTSAAAFLSAMVSFYSHYVTYALWPYMGDREFKNIHRRYTPKLAVLVSVSHGPWFAGGLLLLLFPSDPIGFLSGALNAATSLVVICLSLFVAAPLHETLGRVGIQGNPAYHRLMIISLVRVFLGILAVLSQCAAIYLRCAG